MDVTLPAHARAAVAADTVMRGERVDAANVLPAQVRGELVAALSLATRSSLSLPAEAAGLAPIEE